jgi:hypothetical protein
MVRDDVSHSVRMLISEFKQQVGPARSTPQDVCRYVALNLGISEERARDVIMSEALRQAALTHPTPKI